jgi:hypothetical protein
MVQYATLPVWFDLQKPKISNWWRQNPMAIACEFIDVTVHRIEGVFDDIPH